MKKVYCGICGMYRKFEKPKISYILGKKFSAVSVKMKMKKYLKQKNQLRY